MGKQKILIFSDCYIYGGSEKLMAFLLKNEMLNENFTFLPEDLTMLIVLSSITNLVKWH